MHLYQDISLEELQSCSYLANKQARHEYFLAEEVSETELEYLLSNGWRKFGIYYFRPVCTNCMECRPLRVPAQEFALSKSQKRVWKKNKNLRVVFCNHHYREEIFEVYQKHSQDRFHRESDELEFLQIHYTPSCPTFQSEYYLENKLIAVGFLDKAANSLNSSYFFYDTDFKHLSLGTFSVLAEIYHAAKLGLKYYHLGFYIADNHHMAYKNRFFPHEIFDWRQRIWNKYQKGS